MKGMGGLARILAALMIFGATSAQAGRANLFPARSLVVASLAGTAARIDQTRAALADATRSLGETRAALAEAKKDLASATGEEIGQAQGRVDTLTTQETEQALKVGELTSQLAQLQGQQLADSRTLASIDANLRAMGTGTGRRGGSSASSTALLGLAALAEASSGALQNAARPASSRGSASATPSVPPAPTLAPVPNLSSQLVDTSVAAPTPLPELVAISSAPGTATAPATPAASSRKAR